MSNAVIKNQVYDTAGSFTFTPDPALGVEVIWADAWGGGAGGHSTSSLGGAGNAGGGGGAPEFLERKMIPLEGGSIPVTVGAAGAGGINASGTLPTDGGDSSVGVYVVKGGKANRSAAFSNGYVGGSGGGPRGGVITAGIGNPAQRGRIETPHHTGGWSGGNGGNRSVATETQPVVAPGSFAQGHSGVTGGGGAGANTQWGPGGTGATGQAVSTPSNGSSGLWPGTGGGGASSGLSGADGAAGHAGKVIIYYQVVE